MDDLWNKRQEQLQKALVDAALAFAEYTGMHRFSVPVPNTSPQLWVSLTEDTFGLRTGELSPTWGQ